MFTILCFIALFLLLLLNFKECLKIINVYSLRFSIKSRLFFKTCIFPEFDRVFLIRIVFFQTLFKFPDC